MLPRRIQSICGLLIALAVGRPLGAQGSDAIERRPPRITPRVRSIVEVGGTAVRFPADDTSAIGPSVLAWSVYDAGPLFAAVSAAAVVASGAATGGAALVAGARRAVGASWSAEVGGEVSAIAGSESRLSRSTTLAPRVVRAFGCGGAWAGASGSVAGRELGALWGRSVDAGAWCRSGTASVRASVMREWSAGQLFAGPGRRTPVAVVPVHFDEGAVAAQIERGAAELAVGGALRYDPDAERPYDVALNAQAVLWTSPTFAVTVAAARQLPDFIRGADAAQYVSIGLRWSGRGSRAPLEASAARPVLTVQPAGDSLVLRVHAPGARQVDVTADFTQWEPLALAAEGSAFVRRVKLAPGTYHVLVRVDGGEWKPAANTPAVDDDLGGKVGLVVVPE